MPVIPLDPPSLPTSPAFAQGAMALGPGKLVVVGGQNGVGPDGELVEGGFAAQTRQALRNLLVVLAEAGAGPEHVLRLGIYHAAGEDVREGFEAAQEVWDQRTAITVLAVAGLARPGVLVEIEALAFVPDA